MIRAQHLRTRFFMVLFVFSTIYAFLQAPHFFSFFKEQQSINVLAWPNIIDARYFDDFEKKTGIKVYLTFFENYEELLVKLRSGANDYDLIMATDYVVEAFVEAGIVKKIDKSKFKHWDNMYPSLLSLDYDPDNDYTIPYAWELFGIGVDTNYYKGATPPATWKLLFDKQVAPDTVGMIDDARELVSLGLFYLFGKDAVPTDDQMVEVEKLLLDQKKWVTAYTDLRTDHLLVSQQAPAVLGISYDILHAMKTHKNIQFLIPEEGSFVMVDTFLIPLSTAKDEFVYSFLNYLFEPQVNAKYADRFCFFPVIHIPKELESLHSIRPTKDLFSRLHFFSYHLSENLLRKLWVTIKS